MGETVRMRTANAQPTSYRTGLVAALDVGSSKVTCLIGRAEPGSLKVLGAALRESQGIKSATVTSLEHAEEAIREAVAAAENHADTRIQNVLISVACGAPTSVTARAAAALDGALVSDEHLHILLSEGRNRCRLDGHEVIQAAPTSYVVDEARGVRDPRGMFCQRIGVSMHAVAVKPSPLQNLKLAVERCHLTVAGSLFSGYASGLSTLTPDEMQLGATVIDMGGGVTSIAVFMEGQLVYADVRADGRQPCDVRSRPHAGRAALRGRTNQDALWRGAGRYRDRHRHGRRPPDGRGRRRICRARAALHAHAHRPAAAGRDFRRRCRRSCAPAASMSPPAAAPC